MKQIIFFGGIGNDNQYGGELTKNKEIIRRLRSLGYEVKSFDCYNCRSNVGKLIKLIISFFSFVFLHPQIPIIFSSAYNNINPILSIFNKLKLKNRIIYWVIGGVFAKRINSGIYKREVLNRIDLFIVEGSKMKLDMNVNGYNNVIVVPNFKTIGNTYMNEDRLRSEKTKFLFLSRIIPEKGVKYILQAVDQLNESNITDRFMVDFYGDIDYGFNSEFRKWIEDLPNVEYKGNIDLFKENGYDKLSHYHFMLFPTFWKGEGFPGVVIDAYKIGVPIIASDWNFNEEFIENEVTGLIIPSNSTEALKSAMLKAINMSIPDFSNLVLNCNGKVQSYDTANVLSETLIKQIVGHS